MYKDKIIWLRFEVKVLIEAPCVEALKTIHPVSTSVSNLISAKMSCYDTLLS